MKATIPHLGIVRVRAKGKISRWGTISIVPLKKGRRKKNWEVWSEVLQKYPSPEFYAETNLLIPDELLIFRSETGIEVTSIPASELFMAKTHKVKIPPSRLVFMTKSDGKKEVTFEIEFPEGHEGKDVLVVDLLELDEPYPKIYWVNGSKATL